MCTHACMKQDNRQQSDAHKAMAEAAIAVLDTRFLKALTDVTRVQIVKKLILLGTCDVSTIAAGLSQDRSVISRHLGTLEQARIRARAKSDAGSFIQLTGLMSSRKSRLY